MSDNALRTLPHHGDQPGGAPADDLRIVEAEADLAMLRDLAELGMAVARDLARRALAMPDPPEAPASASPPETPAEPRSDIRPEPRPLSRRDPAEIFVRVSRAVRLTLARKAIAVDRLAALRAGERVSPAVEAPRNGAVDAAPPARGWDRLPRDYPSAHRNRVRDAVFGAVNHEITDVDQAQDILDSLYERLNEGERYDAFIHRPLRETVAAICDDLGLHPDWSRWTDGAGWPPRPKNGAAYVWELVWSPSRERMARRLQ